MKRPLELPFCARAAGLAVVFLACPLAASEMRDAATHEQLSQKLQQMEQSDPMKNLKPAQGEDPAKNLPKDLVSQSDIISFAGKTTLVPKRAIIRVPKNYADRLRFEEGSKILGWADFYAANRGWITTVEVTRVQAEGKEPIAEDTVKVFEKSGNLVVAVYQGGPISMLPAAQPDANATTPPAK